MTVSELEFRSKLEDMMTVSELVFEPTPGFGKWRKFFPEDAIRHPAKANLNLINFLIDKYSREGDLILDPMAGTGSTCVLAALKGRDAICIDIEPLFFQWMEKAREIVEKTPMLGRKGRIINILGDARRLSELLKQIDIVITSPPYAETISHKSGGPVKKIVNVGISTITARTYSENENNIGNLPLGDMSRSEGRPTYFSEMLKVYNEMYKVLKPNGYAIVIIKPFIRNRQVIDLPYYTWLMMEKIGFKLEKIYKLRLETKSFWRVLYYKKYPDVPRINHEYIIIGKK